LAADRLDQLRVVDFTYVATWSGLVYVAFCVDVYARMITGWQASKSMSTDLVLDAREMGIWQRARVGRSLQGLVHHSDPAASTPRSATPSGSPKPVCAPRSGRSGTPTATPWPNRSSACSRPK